MGKVSVLNQNRDFRRIYAKGRAFVDPALVTYVLKNKQGYVRCGITASKKIGCAVERNRARRVIREAAREVLPGVSRGVDLVFVARSRKVRLKSTDVARVLRRHLNEAGLAAHGEPR